MLLVGHVLCRLRSSYKTQSPLHCLNSTTLCLNSRTSPTSAVSSLAVRLPLLTKDFSFRLYDNPLRKEIAEQLKTGVKQMMDFLKTEDYRTYVSHDHHMIVT